MLEVIADVDDHMMEKYIAGAEISPSEIQAALRKGTVALKFVPVLCGAAFKNKGIQQLLDAIVAYLPSPLDIPPVTGVKQEERNLRYERSPTMSLSPGWSSRS